MNARCAVFAAGGYDSRLPKHGAGQALEIVKEFPDDQIFLIPAMLEECEIANEEVSQFNFAMLFPDWDQGVKTIRLAAGIRPSKKRTAASPASDRRKSKVALSSSPAYEIKIVLLNVTLPKLRSVLKALNSAQSFFHFTLLELDPPTRPFTRIEGEPQLYLDRLSKQFYARVAPLETDHTICVTDRFLAFDEGRSLYYNYLAYVGLGEDERIAFNSTRGLQEHATEASVSMEQALSYGLVSDVAAYFLRLDYHRAIRGCP